MDDPIADLRLRFVYRAETRDRWTLLTAPTGPLTGDCDDYALTALWLCAGRSWWRLWWLVISCQAMLWLTRVHGTGDLHIMAWVRGRGWTDNVHPDWSQTPHHPRWVPYLAPFMALALLLKRAKS